MGPHRPAGLTASRAPFGLLVALLITTTYAVFAHGATDTPSETRVQLALAVLALPTVGALAVGGRTALRADGLRSARVGLLLLLAFAVWSALTMLWSVAPSSTWTEVNRAVAYALMAGLGFVVAANLPRALERLAVGFLGLVVVVALYGLGIKTIPGVNLLGVDFNQAGTLSRLQSPLDYWNALGLLLAMGIPVALRIAGDVTRGRAARIGAVLAIYVLIIDIGMTYSRGAIVAVAVSLVVLAVLGRDRLATLVAAVVAALAAAGPLALALTKDGLSTSGIPLGTRIHDGRQLLALTALVAVIVIAVVAALLRHEDRLRWPAARTATVGRLIVVALSAVVLLGVLGATAGTRGLPGNVHQVVRDFTIPTADKQTDPSRLTTTTSGNRWIWWNEALGAWSDKPLGGYGAGSFRTTHLFYRPNTIAVSQPHSVPLQFLAETGLIGLLLAYGGLGALFFAAVARVRALPDGRERELGVALLAAAIAWVVHGLFEWDWDIPGVTLPALLLLGAVAGVTRSGDAPGSGPGPGPGPGLGAAAAPGPPRVVVFVDPEREGRLRPATVAGVVAVTIALFAYATSAILPAWSASKSDAAQAAIGQDAVTDDQLRSAAAKADLAARLDPVSIEPLLVSATIAQRRGRDLEAREDLLEAVGRQPDSSRAWNALAALALPLADRQGFIDATARALELDPHNPFLRTLAARAISFATPPGESATATGTPLPAAAGSAATPAPAAATGTVTPDPASPIAGAPGTDPGSTPPGSVTGSPPPGTTTPGVTPGVTPGTTTPGTTTPGEATPGTTAPAAPTTP
ncbi:O-antigen ligase family protein [Paraconexibacter sp. AEG42_29]|uniref:O-antigen ligase family protein n=1 Tax=Paraconexibacter sp. AEG42_29 TaxID=2997339 RepID=UPI00339D5D58